MSLPTPPRNSSVKTVLAVKTRLATCHDTEASACLVRRSSDAVEAAAASSSRRTQRLTRERDFTSDTRALGHISTVEKMSATRMSNMIDRRLLNRARARGLVDERQMVVMLREWRMDARAAARALEEDLRTTLATITVDSRAEEEEQDGSEGGWDSWAQ